ncbi:MAG: PIN domain-containing protein [Proteobacteria bacterium]|nr:PIN domain-containing protein [Pseudomonadota bacterium]
MVDCAPVATKGEDGSLAAAAAVDHGAACAVVLDTNVALDLLLFGDPATEPLARLLAAGRLCWIATGAMRSELARVLDYPAIVAQLARRDDAGARVLQAFDARVQRVGRPEVASLCCADPDDQMFIDLALAHRALLLSRDRALLQLHGPLTAIGVEVRTAVAFA